MAKKPLTTDSEFTVGEEKVLVYILAALFLGLFLYGLTDAILKQFKNITYLSYLSFLTLLPAIALFQKGRSNRIYIRVNKKGFYKDERLLTSWPNFIKAYITQKEAVLDIRDNFELVIEYRKDGQAGGFRRRIPLTNTQNKSEEDVLEAIQFFVKAYHREQGFIDFGR